MCQYARRTIHADSANGRSQALSRRGTNSVAHIGMRTPLIIVSVAAVLVAGCEKAIAPTVAGLGGISSNPPGNVSSSTAPLVISPTSAQLRVGGTFQFNTNAP